MPIYDYACPSCRNRFELLQRLGETGENLDCPSCGHQPVSKQFSTFAGMTGGKSDPAPSDFGCGQASCCQMLQRACGSVRR